MVLLRIGMIWLFRGENTYQASTDATVFEKYRRKRGGGGGKKLIVSLLRGKRAL